MTDLDVRPLPNPSLDFLDWTVEPRQSLLRRSVQRIRAIREIGLLTLVALAGYIAAGFWMFYVKHFFINDELNRVADALYVTVGRDPHLGAIGFYWPPLPQLLNCIFVPLLEPFGATVMAGPVETACCMALTIPVLAQIGKSLGVGRWTTFGICAAFAITPVTIYNSTNGMSEACFFLTGSLTMLGFLRYLRSRSTGDMILFSLAMCAFILTRLEGPFEVVLLVVVASFEWPSLRSAKVLRQNAWTAALLGLPPLACFGFWMLVQWILLKDPLFFLHQAGGAAAPTSPVWLPNADEGPVRVIPWAGHWILVLGVVMVVALLGVIVRPRSDRTRGSIGILGAMGIILALQMYTVGFKGGFGDPRYFSMAVPFGAVTAMWLASRPRPAPLNPSPSRWRGTTVWNVGLIAILVVNAGTGSWTMSSATTTGIEHECIFFQGGVAQLLPFLGRGGTRGTKAYCRPDNDGIKAFRTAGAWLDKRLKPTDRVLTDNSSIFAADLFTRHPDQYIVRNDRDWEKIVADPGTKVTYIITESPRKGGPPEVIAGTTPGAGSETDYGADIVNGRPQAWKLVFEAPGAENAAVGPVAWLQVYRATGVPPAGINAPTGLSSQ